LIRFLADVNFLIAILDIKHEHSVRAELWLNKVGERHSIVICRVAQMGAIRLLTRQSIMDAGVLTGAVAWGYLTKLFEDDRFVFANEPAGFESAWQTIYEWTPKGSSAETDSYLAAFAIAGSLSVVTFDGCMNRFPGLKVETPR